MVCFVGMILGRMGKNKEGKIGEKVVGRGVGRENCWGLDFFLRVHQNSISPNWEENRGRGIVAMT